jgi:hypothetical protein
MTPSILTPGDDEGERGGGGDGSVSLPGSLRLVRLPCLCVLRAVCPAPRSEWDFLKRTIVDDKVLATVEVRRQPA